MSWSNRHRIRHYMRHSIWLMPAFGMIAGLLCVWSLHRLESNLGWNADLSPEGARVVLGTLAGSMFTFIVFVSSALLVAFQLASAQLSPRIIAIVFRDPITKWSLTIFVFTFTVALATVVRVDETVPLLTTRLTTYSCIVSIALFLHLIDHVGKILRPSGAFKSVAAIGRAVIDDVYPRPVTDSHVEPYRAPFATMESPGVIASDEGGVLLAFDIHGLTKLAKAGECVIEMAPQVGDSVAPGDPLFRVTPANAKITLESLCGSVALGQERSVEQDPLFLFRILVDISSKALSPAINDPTSAVLAIDQIHHLLRIVGVRWLDEGRIHDADGNLRLVYRTPNWEDFVQLAVTEIRLFGATSISIPRRLRAMLENLIEVLPEERSHVLLNELALLDKTVDRAFPDPGDRALAGVSDMQGVGGADLPRKIVLT